MKQPISPLPWTYNDLDDTIIDIEGSNVVEVEYANISADDVNYMLEACNNFPRAVELLRRVLVIPDLSKVYPTTYSNIEQFLNRLNNG